MNNQERIDVVEAMHKTAMKIIIEKGESYADGDRDTLSNFKQVAERGGVTVIQAWLNYYLKHEIAIELAIKKNPETPVEGTEGILSRLLDAKNYLDLLACILVEKGMLEIGTDGNMVDLVKNPKPTSFTFAGTGSGTHYEHGVNITSSGALSSKHECDVFSKEEKASPEFVNFLVNGIYKDTLNVFNGYKKMSEFNISAVEQDVVSMIRKYLV